MKRRKRHLKRSFKYCLLFVFIFFIIVFIIYNINFYFIGKKSVHEDALTYKTRSCLVFYPNSKKGEDVAKEICSKAKNNVIYDYALIPYGDYYRICYKNGSQYYTDKNYNELVISNINDEGKKIISDYLRYQLKKEENDIAYTYDFLNDTFYENLDLNDVDYQIKANEWICHFPKYNADIKIPLKYLELACDLDLGYENISYQRPHFISLKRKMVCLTFDDGPDVNLKTSSQIVDTLYKFDSSATFFVLGNRLGKKQIAFCKESIEKGMEYGSHSQSHQNLTKLSLDEAVNEIMIPYHDLNDGEYGFGYKMKLFRPPYGAYDESLSKASGLTAILWNVDSLDWSYRTKYETNQASDIIYDKVITETDENDIVLFHDIYQTSADAACKSITYFIKNGYQIVNASQLLIALGINDIYCFSGK